MKKNVKYRFFVEKYKGSMRIKTIYIKINQNGKAYRKYNDSGHVISGYTFKELIKSTCLKEVTEEEVALII